MLGILHFGTNFLHVVLRTTQLFLYLCEMVESEGQLHITLHEFPYFGFGLIYIPPTGIPSSILEVECMQIPILFLNFQSNKSTSYHAFTSINVENLE
jgi:hypothetical protein